MRALTDRTTITSLLAAALVLAGGLLRPEPLFPTNGLLPDRFWAQKMLWSARYDVVLVGDSLAFRGLSPQAMQKVLAGREIVNFAFSACSVGTPGYLEAAEALLDPDSDLKAIVLEINPGTLTLETAERNEFISLSEKNAVEIYEMRYLAELIHFFRPYDRRALRDSLLRRQSEEVTRVFFSDGWIAGRRPSDDPSVVRSALQKNLKASERHFLYSPVSEEILARVLARVEQLTAGGVRVYGFRPPVVTEVIELENRLSGFDESAFVERFERAGGTWLRFPEASYATVDGAHLRDDAAVQFSEDLARKLLQAGLPLEAGRTPSCPPDASPP